MKRQDQATGNAASRLIDQRVRDLAGWRGETLARMRALILEADPGMIEEWKWMGTPVWSHDGIVSHRASSIPAWMATRAGRSTSTKGRPSTRARSRRS